MSLINSVRASIPYAQVLSESGKRIALPSNSDFVPLVRAASPAGECHHGMTQDEFLNVVEASEGGVISGTIAPLSEYEEIRGAMKDRLVELLRSHIRISQAVAGVVTDAAERVKKYMANVPDDSPAGRFSIIQDPLADLFEGDWFQDLISKSPVVVRQPSSALVTKPLDPEVIEQLVKTGDVEIDNGLAQAASFFALDGYGRPRSLAEDVYVGFFLNQNPKTKFYNLREFQKLPAGERLVVLATAYLIADKLHNNTPEDAVGTLHQFETNCQAVKDIAIQGMINAFGEKKHQIENGVVVLDYYHTPTSLVVDKTSYDAFLNAGGAPELILGCKVTELGFYSAKELVDNADRAARAWRQYALLNNATAENERRGLLRAIYKATWAEMVESGPEFEMELRSKNSAMIGEYTDIAYKWIEEQDLATLEDPFKTMEHLMASIRFEYTPAAFFLKEMRKASAKHPNADPRESATVAAIKYMANYALTQMSVTNVQAQS